MDVDCLEDGDQIMRPIQLSRNGKEIRAIGKQLTNNPESKCIPCIFVLEPMKKP